MSSFRIRPADELSAILSSPFPIFNSLNRYQVAG